MGGLQQKDGLAVEGSLSLREAEANEMSSSGRRLSGNSRCPMAQGLLFLSLSHSPLLVGASTNSCKGLLRSAAAKCVDGKRFRIRGFLIVASRLLKSGQRDCHAWIWRLLSSAERPASQTSGTVMSILDQQADVHANSSKLAHAHRLVTRCLFTPVPNYDRINSTICV